MQCPHCLQNFHERYSHNLIGQDKNGSWLVRHTECPACNQLVMFLMNTYQDGRAGGISRTRSDSLFYPKGSSRPPVPVEVEVANKVLADDYKEACIVLTDSLKASAALSRRCLQILLRTVAKVKHGNLSDEIQQVIDSNSLPSYLQENIDAVRNIGNFAAHPIKSKSSGEIVDVEPGEAEWNLDVLESLFDFYYVQPAVLKKKRDALNQKLRDAAKPEMK
jgi:hypothetical protein